MKNCFPQSLGKINGEKRDSKIRMRKSLNEQGNYFKFIKFLFYHFFSLLHWKREKKKSSRVVFSLFFPLFWTINSKRGGSLLMMEVWRRFPAFLIYRIYFDLNFLSSPIFIFCGSQVNLLSHFQSRLMFFQGEENFRIIFRYYFRNFWGREIKRGC